MDKKVATARIKVPAAVAASAVVVTQLVIRPNGSFGPTDHLVESKFSAVIELLVFSLAEGADDEAFLACDKQVQTDFAYQQPGLLRRTTARGARGSWAVIDLWASAAAADACDSRWETDPLAREFMSFVDPATVRTARFFELD
jgi:hypothetical protein